MTGRVTVVIPTIPPRRDLLMRALNSVWNQERPADAVSIAVDHHHEGAWVTRQRALDAVQTEWTAFLDDDNAFLPDHLSSLMDHAAKTGADYVFSYFDTWESKSIDPLRVFGKPFDNANPHHTTMTILVRTELAKSVGFTPPSPGDLVGGEDWRFTLGCVERNAKIVHLPKYTWVWYWSYTNTSGMPDRW